MNHFIIEQRKSGWAIVPPPPKKKVLPKSSRRKKCSAKRVTKNKWMELYSLDGMYGEKSSPTIPPLGN